MLSDKTNSFDELMFPEIFNQYNSKDKKIINNNIDCNEVSTSSDIQGKPNLLNFNIEKMFDDLQEINGIDISKEHLECQSDKFCKWFEQFANIVQSSPNDAAIYSKIGLLSSKYHYSYKTKLETIIKNYIKKLIGNKYLLICLLYKCMIVTLRLIGNCDFNNYESFSNKWIEDFLKNDKLNATSIIDKIKKKTDKYIFPNENDKDIKTIFNTIINKLYTNDDKKINIDIDLSSDVNPSGGGDGDDDGAYVNPLSGIPEEKENAGEERYPKSRQRTSFFPDLKDKLLPKPIINVFNQTLRTGEMVRDAQYKALKDLVSGQRTNIMNKYQLLKNQFCCNSELAATAASNPVDLWWSRTPSLVAYAVATTNLTANAMMNQGLGGLPSFSVTSIASQISPMVSASSSIALASVINAALGPIMGLFVGVVVGTISESLWFKDLRNSRLANLAFQSFIDSEKNLKNKLEKNEILVNNNICTYRGHRKEYIFRFFLAQSINALYDSLCEEYFVKPLKKLDFYMFLYQVNVKIEELNNELSEEPIVNSPPQGKATRSNNTFSKIGGKRSRKNKKRRNK